MKIYFFLFYDWYPPLESAVFYKQSRTINRRATHIITEMKQSLCRLLSIGYTANKFYFKMVSVLN